MPQGRHGTRERNGELKSRWTTLILIVLCLAIPSGASAKPPHPLVKAELAKRPLVKKRAYSSCKPARLGLVYYKLRHASWMELRGITTKPRFNFPRGCAHTLWRAKLWRSRAIAAREAYHKWQRSQFVLHDFQVVAGNNAWLQAVEEAQKPYPGTAAWLKSCSSTEGGWGRWVPNNDGAPPGGWMQMYESTFWRMWKHGWYDSGRTYPSAYDSLRARGYKVPASAHSWYSPLGQALASAHGYANGRRGEWHSTGCYIN